MSAPLAESGATAPRPVPGFALGIVGHRPERIVDADQVSERLEQIIGLVTAVLAQKRAETGLSDDDVRLRLVSALAEGADRLGASAGLQAGAALDVILPLPPSDYVQDFVTEPSREAFDAFLEVADSVLVLDGAPSERDRAYDAAGLALLDNCDLLVAVWDGQPGRGRGGTREVIEEAARRELVIVTISANGATVKLYDPQLAPPGALRFADIPTRGIDSLPAVLANIVDLRAHGAPEWLTKPPPPARGWMYAAYPMLLRAVGAGPKRKRRGPSEAAPQPGTALDSAFDWWDRAAIAAAQAFRSAVIVNFGLAALAVLLAAFSVLVDEAKWQFVVAEIATIILLLINNWYAGRQKWQERWLESREVAELLRVGILLRQVGISRGIADSPNAGWSTRYAGALTRSVAPDGIDLSKPRDAATAVVGAIESQAAWNESTAQRMHKIAHRIERFGEVLFITVLALAMGWLVLRFAWPRQALLSKYWLTALTAGLPAIATASYGIRIILDFEGVAGRSHHLATALRASLANWHANEPSAAALQGFVRQSVDAMLGDVTSWRLLAEGRRLAVPG